METLFRLSYTGMGCIIVACSDPATPNAFVEKIGFEPTTFCLPDRRSARLSYIPHTGKGTGLEPVSPTFRPRIGLSGSSR